MRRLSEAGVGMRVYYPIPSHRLEPMRRIFGDISLPAHPLAAPEDLRTKVWEVNRL